jgi:hypothetical protein
MDVRRICTPILVLIQPIYTARAEMGYVTPPSSIGGTKDLGTAPGNGTWSHYVIRYSNRQEGAYIPWQPDLADAHTPRHHVQHVM